MKITTKMTRRFTDQELADTAAKSTSRLNRYQGTILATSASASEATSSVCNRAAHHRSQVATRNRSAVSAVRDTSARCRWPRRSTSLRQRPRPRPHYRLISMPMHTKEQRNEADVRFAAKRIALEKSLGPHPDLAFSARKLLKSFLFLRPLKFS